MLGAGVGENRKEALWCKQMASSEILLEFCTEDYWELLLIIKCQEARLDLGNPMCPSHKIS